jgi:SAM-dependent methyltransferase
VLREVAYASSGLLADRAALYAARVPPVNLPAWVLSHLPDQLPGPVLDAGCGPGWYLRTATEAGHAALGLDLSFGMALEAAGTAPAAVADAQRMPVRGGTVGAVLMMHMLYHVPQPAMALREARRVLSPGGVVAVVTNTPRHLGAMRVALRDELIAAAIEPAENVEAHFDSVSGPPYLNDVFSTVTAVPLEGVVRLDRPEPALAHLASTRHCYPQVDDATWLAVLSGVRDKIEAEISGRGAWATAASSVLYLCSIAPEHDLGGSASSEPRPVMVPPNA